jgi:hypothetical protein
MQFKVKVILAVAAFVVIGLITYYLLRKKDDDDISIEEPDVSIEPDEIVTSPVEDVLRPSAQEPTPEATPAKPLVPEKPTAPIKLPAPEPEEPTPTTTPAKPLVPDKQPTQSSSMVVGVPGKFGSEGGHDVNNSVDILSFAKAKSALVYVEHIDVHRGDPLNKNASITFKYEDGTKHKFTFVGNEGLRFMKKDGSFGEHIHRAGQDVSDIVLREVGLPLNSYKIKCVKLSPGRNTWQFTPLQLSKGLIGIDMSDNAEWAGLRGVYVKVKS